jgi:hypothetical protein
MKKRLAGIDSFVEKCWVANARMISEENAARILELAFEMSQDRRGLALALLDSNVLDVIEELHTLVQRQDSDVSFGAFDETQIDYYLKTAKEKEAKAKDVVVGFVFHDHSPEIETFLSGINVCGKGPTSQDDWKKVIKELERRKEHLSRHQLLQRFDKYGCSKDELCSNDGTFQEGFISDLHDGKEMKRLFCELSEECQDSMTRIIKLLIHEPDIAKKDKLTEERLGGPKEVQFDTTILQETRCRLVTKIQHLEEQEVEERVLATLGTKISANDLGEIVSFCRAVGDAKADALDKVDPSSPRTKRQYEIIRDAFVKTAKFMPLLVMTHEQCSSMLGPTQQFDLGIIDEASQSEISALTILFRCKQIVGVGDENQNSPSLKGKSEDWIDEVAELAPADIFSRDRLRPGSSLFDIFMTAFSSTSTYIFLNEHFRCDPRIAKTFNKLFYHDSLQLMRLSGKDDALIDIFVDLKQKNNQQSLRDEKKTIQPVLDVVRKIVEDQIVGAFNGENKVKTIGIISLDRKTLSLIEDEIKVLSEELINHFNDEIVEAHNIVVGEPSRFQGDERNLVIFVSTKIGEIQQAKVYDKQWCVALSRATDILYNIRTYDRKSLRPKDIRRKVFPLFTNDETPSSIQGALRPLKRAPGQNINVHSLLRRVEVLLASKLSKNFIVCRNDDGNTWNHALRISSHCGFGNALLCIENIDESQDAWKKTVEEQQSLERAGRYCLRMPLVMLALDFRQGLATVRKFLERAGLKEADNTAATIIIQRKRPGLDAVEQSPAKRRNTGQYHGLTGAATDSSAKRSLPDSHKSIVAMAKHFRNDIPEEKKERDDDAEAGSMGEHLSGSGSSGAAEKNAVASKERKSVEFKALRSKLHLGDIKIELLARGITIPSGAKKFTELKEMLHENVGTRATCFIPKSEAKFSMEVSPPKPPKMLL